MFFRLDCVCIDFNTYNALGIFSLESHPSAFKSTATKEGVSLFSLMASYTKVSAGESLNQ